MVIHRTEVWSRCWKENQRQGQGYTEEAILPSESNRKQVQELSPRVGFPVITQETEGRDHNSTAALKTRRGGSATAETTWVTAEWET